MKNIIKSGPPAYPDAEPHHSEHLTGITEALCDESSEQAAFLHRAAVQHQVPSREVVIDLMEKLRSVLFPGYFGPKDLTAETKRFHIGATLDQIQKVLTDQVQRGFCFDCDSDHRYCHSPDCEHRAVSVVRVFMSQLPRIQKLLMLDVNAAYEGDPAASSPGETIFCYPGIMAMTNYRIAHELHIQGVPLIPRIISEHAHSVTGIDIHPGAQVGDRFFIDHGTGVVIGETTIIGENVRIYQGVTLGAKSFPLDEQGNPIKGIARHPVVEDNVIIYSGATILGRVTIGSGSVIGGNVWITSDIPPGSKITQRRSRLSGLNTQDN